MMPGGGVTVTSVAVAGAAVASGAEVASVGADFLVAILISFDFLLWRLIARHDAAGSIGGALIETGGL